MPERGCVISCLLLTVLAAIPSGLVQAADLLPPETPIELVIDQTIGAARAAQGITPNPQVDDANFLRRVTLDIAGRVPSAGELQAYLANADPAKRQQLVDRLVNSPDYAFHMRNRFDAMFMNDRNEGGWREYLLQAFQENRPWDQMFREMLLARDDDEKLKGALGFLKSRVRDLDDTTNDTSRLFFGVSINCAKCHDHPLVLDWRQDHYFGMSSFFNRLYMNKRNQIAERDVGFVKFKTTEGVEKDAALMFLTGKVVPEPEQPALSDEEKKNREKAQKEEEEKKEGPPPPAPAFSRRDKLVETALHSEDNYFFSRNIVNRVFALMLGRGLVMPLDQMHSQNPASHPELLDWLARDLVTHGYDIKRLVRGIALSQTYSLSSRWETGDPPAESTFAYGLTKPMSPKQYSLSLLIATTVPDRFPVDLAPEEYAKRRNDYENASHGFANQLELPIDGSAFQVSVSEALLFSNAQHVENEYAGDRGDRIVGELKKLEDKQEAVRRAFLQILQRQPDPEESAAAVKYLTDRADRPVQALQHLVWSMITSSEFRFNY